MLSTSQQEGKISVFEDKSTGDTYLRLFLIGNEYINKQNWKVGPRNFDRNVQRSLGHSLVIYPAQDTKSGKVILDHPPYKTATASDIKTSYENQEKYAIGKAISNRKYKPSQYHSIYRLTDPNAARFFKENSDEQGNFKYPIFTSPGILYTDKTDLDWEDWIISHNAIVTSPANKEEDAGFFKQCTGDLDTTCQHIAASLQTPCMLEKFKPLGNIEDSYSLLNTVLLSSQEQNKQTKHIMSEQASKGQGQEPNSQDGNNNQTNNNIMQALISSDKNINISQADIEKLANDNKIPKELIGTLVDYKAKYHELISKQQNTEKQNKQQSSEQQTNNNNDTKYSELQIQIDKLKRTNEIQKLLPSQLFKSQEDYDKEVDKLVNSKYDVSDLKEIVSVKIEKANIEAQKAQMNNNNNQSGNNPQPNSAIASWFTNGVKSESASTTINNDSDSKTPNVELDKLTHIKTLRSLVLNNTFGDLI